MPPFAITTEAGTFAVTEWTAPAERVLGADDRTCRLAVAWTPTGVVAEPRTCPDEVAREAVGALGRWRWTAPAGLAGRHELGEVWFVYPYEPADVVRVMVRQSNERRLSLPDGVDAVPYAIRAWSFVRWPAQVHRPDHPEIACVVDVHADVRGLTTEVEARGCPEPFSAAAVGAIAEWRFVPPLVGGEPIPSALSLTATFSARGASATGAPVPDVERRQLWDDGAFEELTRDERLWFIRATLLGPGDRDLGPGRVSVGLPAPPDLGGRVAPDYWAADGFERGVPPLPDHPPVFVLGRPDHLAIEVFDLALPDPARVEPSARGTRCDLLVQVDGTRRVFSWAEACDPAARESALLTADGWLLRHDGRPIGEERVQFRATVAFGADGAATVRIDADEVRSPIEALPREVHTFRDPRPELRMPPKLPRDVVLPNESCELAVDLDLRGRPERVAVVTCPDGFATLAERAVRRWRWRPAEEDGAPVPSRTEVTIRFGS